VSSTTRLRLFPALIASQKTIPLAYRKRKIGGDITCFYFPLLLEPTCATSAARAHITTPVPITSKDSTCAAHVPIISRSRVHLVLFRGFHVEVEQSVLGNLGHQALDLLGQIIHGEYSVMSKDTVWCTITPALPQSSYKQIFKHQNQAPNLTRWHAPAQSQSL
jgi:hypothetical protein